MKLKIEQNNIRYIQILMSFPFEITIFKKNTEYMYTGRIISKITSGQKNKRFFILKYIDKFQHNGSFYE